MVMMIQWMMMLVKMYFINNYDNRQVPTIVLNREVKNLLAKTVVQQPKVQHDLLLRHMQPIQIRVPLFRGEACSGHCVIRVDSF